MLALVGQLIGEDRIIFAVFAPLVALMLVRWALLHWLDADESMAWWKVAVLIAGLAIAAMLSILAATWLVVRTG